MIVRMRSVSLSRWGRTSLVLAVASLPLFASCTKSEDTEPFVPASEGAKQPSGKGALITEDAACDQLLKAASAAYDDLHCDSPNFPDCPGFLRPGGGSGCYEYYEDSVTACVKAYQDADSCRNLSPCLVTAEFDDTLPTCQLPSGGEGGGGGVSGNTLGGASNAGASNGGAPSGGAPSPVAGSPGAGGAAGAAGQAGAGP